MAMDETQGEHDGAQPEETVVSAEPIRPYTTGIYRAPFVGRYLRETREFADGLRPTDEDSWGVRAGKNLVRTGIVAGTTGVVMIAVL